MRVDDESAGNDGSSCASPEHPGHAPNRRGDTPYGACGIDTGDHGVGTTHLAEGDCRAEKPLLL
jgi:hypothetical protein